MINVSDELKNAFLTGNQKNLTLYFSDGSSLTGDSIVLESMRIEQLLCNEQQLTFGLCNAAKFTIQIYNEQITHKDMIVSPVISTTGDTVYTMNLGVYAVVEDVVSDDRNTRTLTCYDALYRVVNENYAAWYKSLSMPMTLKQFRDAFFSHVGIVQETITLPNDGMTVEKTIDTNSLSGSAILKAILEPNASFGFINYSGHFQYTLWEKGTGLYPASDLFPADDLYPVGVSANTFGESEESMPVLDTLIYADYDVEEITGVKIQTSSEDYGTTIGNPRNIYQILGNFLLFGKSAADLQAIGTNFLRYADQLFFRPCKFKARSHPWIELGDIIAVDSSQIRVVMPVLKKTITGITALYDEYEAQGSEKYTEQANNLNTMVENLKYKTLELKVGIDEVSSQLTEKVDNTTFVSTIKQLPHTISMSVSGKAGQTTSAGIVVSLYDEDGNLIDSGDGRIELSGEVTFKSNLTDGTTRISGDNLKTGTIEAASIYLHGNSYWTRIDASTGNLSWNMEKSKLSTNGELTLRFNNNDMLVLTTADWTGTSNHGANFNAAPNATFIGFGHRSNDSDPWTYPLVLNFGLNPHYPETGSSYTIDEDIIVYGTMAWVGQYGNYYRGKVNSEWAYINNYDGDEGVGLCLDLVTDWDCDAITIDGSMILTSNTLTKYMNPSLKIDSGNTYAYAIKFNKTYADASIQSDSIFDPDYCTYACTVLEAKFLADTFSDRRIKTDISNIDDKMLSFYEHLMPVSFKYKDDVYHLMKSSKNNGSRFGFIAQDVKALLDECEIEDCDITYQTSPSPHNEINKLCEDGVYKMNYDDFHALHVQYAHHLKNIIDEQQKTIDALEERIARLEALIGDK